MSSTEPRRSTPTERLHEVTMAALARHPAEAEHNIEISRNAKGVAQFTVGVRGPDLAHIVTQATATFDKLCVLYPYPTNEGNNTATAGA